MHIFVATVCIHHIFGNIGNKLSTLLSRFLNYGGFNVSLYFICNVY